MGAGQNASLGTSSSTASPSVSSAPISKPTINTIDPIDREQIKLEFYRTYDVMTGIRIAATLGGFFGLMVILVVYKSKSKTERALEDPKLAAAAKADAEEEEQRQLQAAIEATVFEQLQAKSRRSVDYGNSPASWARTARRFSSIGGYSSLMDPIRTHSPRLPSFVDEDSAAEEEDLEDISTFDRHLEVPRRPSNVTCSSSGSSYLERRGSSVVLGLPAVPAHKSCGRRRQSSPLPEQYDFYYPIDIRVIQPTPRNSPCGSERALYDHPSPRRAPLASISSCNSSLGADYPELESDSIFRAEEDTDDDVDPFSTDSESSESGRSWRKRSGKKHHHRRPSTKIRRVASIPPCISENLSPDEEGFDQLQPGSSKGFVFVRKPSVTDYSLSVSESIPLVKEASCGRRPQQPLPISPLSQESLTLVEEDMRGSSVVLPTLPLTETSSPSPLRKAEGSWSQETLF